MGGGIYSRIDRLTRFSKAQRNRKYREILQRFSRFFKHVVFLNHMPPIISDSGAECSNSERLSINADYLTDKFSEEFKKTLSGFGVNSQPFPHFSLPQFVSDLSFVRNLASELLSANWHRKENDLYSLDQTLDLANFGEDFPFLHKYRQFLCTTVRDWLMRVSGKVLNDKVALTGSNYKYSDLLLAHDDQLEGRKFAFILYLTPVWREEYGGQLELFSCDDSNCPVTVAKKIYPEENCFNMFEVSPRSWHRVSEVLSEEHSRLSINGWFHSDDVVLSVNPVPHLFSKQKPSMDVTYEEVIQWINPEYIAPEEQRKVRHIFGKKSEIDLAHFLRKELYEAALKELNNYDFELTGPPSKREIGCLREYSLPGDSHLRSLLRLFRSRAMTLLLTQWTGLNLFPVKELMDSSEPDAKRTRKNEEIDIGNADNVNSPVELRSSIMRFTKGCFTMADDQLAADTEKNGFCLDVQLFFCEDKWDDETGGYTSYIAQNEAGELLRVSPAGNSLALVYREPEVFSFVKYVNSRAGDRLFYVLNCSFFGISDTDTSTEDSEETTSEESEDEGTLSGDDFNEDLLKNG
ncbi:hypothetical protein AB6A40_003645 [Gnathostoma spinigerum]|uniref:Prolyl 4-hydroxylase alpha subunit domain-containing protein n=1 Tax=Gnathostoma spinigerum TaxID=75299 RepID=A0ABD6ECL3_9BILA